MKTLEKRADLLRMHADAQLGLGQIELGCAQYQEALNLDAKLAAAYWGLARCARIREGAEAARVLYRKALELNPKSARTQVEFGNFEYGLGHLMEAERHYAEAIKLDGELLQARAGMALVMFLQGRVDQAATEVEQLSKQHPDSPMAKSLRGMLAYQKGDMAAALRLSAEALKDIPHHTFTLVQYGRAAYSLGDYEAAWRGLSRALLANPRDVALRKMVAASEINTKRYVNALETLAPLLGEQSKDTEALALAGAAHTLLNKVPAAIRAYERILALKPQSSSANLALGKIRMSTQEWPAAKDHFRKVLAIAPDHTEAGLDLARLHRTTRDYREALRIVEEIERKQPKLATATLLKAQILYDMKDPSAARRTLEGRLAAEPTDVDAVLNIARIDLAEKKFADAKRRVESALELKKDHVEALLMRARIAGAEGDAKGHLKGLEQVVRAHPADILPVMEISRLLLAMGQGYKALEWARQAEKMKPDSPDVLMLLAEVQLAAGEKENALATYQRLASSVLPNSPAVHLRHAQLQIAVNSNREGARFSLIQALKLQPDHLDVQTALIRLDTDNRKYGPALETARKVQAQRPGAAVGHMLEGDVLLAQNRYTTAADAYRKGVDKKGGGAAMISLHRALTLAGRKAEAEKTLDDWIAKYPNDVTVRFHRSQAAMESERYDQAREQLEAIQRLRPDIPNVLNNLAILYARMGDPRALEFAQRAYKQAPESPLIADTLGWMLVQRGQADQGVPLLRKALAAQPEHPGINFHLAAALARTGARNEALGILRRLLSHPGSFPDRPQAEALWKQLNG